MQKANGNIILILILERRYYQALHASRAGKNYRFIQILPGLVTKSLNLVTLASAELYLKSKPISNFFSDPCKLQDSGFLDIFQKVRPKHERESRQSSPCTCATSLCSRFQAIQGKYFITEDLDLRVALKADLVIEMQIWSLLLNILYKVHQIWSLLLNLLYKYY